MNRMQRAMLIFFYRHPAARRLVMLAVTLIGLYLIVFQFSTPMGGRGGSIPAGYLGILLAGAFGLSLAYNLWKPESWDRSHVGQVARALVEERDGTSRDGAGAGAPRSD